MLTKVQKRRHLSYSKLPKSKSTRYIGVEVEFFTKSPRVALVNALEPLYNKVHIDYDGSINEPDGASSYEVKLLTSERSYMKDVETLCKALRKVKARVNSSCGLHVHLDMRYKSWDHVKGVYKRLVSALPWFTKMMPKSRLSNNFCRINSKPTDYNDSERYLAVNLSAYHKYKTIEVRLHSGTVNREKITRWITLLLATANASTSDFSKTDINDFGKTIKVSDEDVAYMKKRIAKMNEPDKEELDQLEETNASYYNMEEPDMDFDENRVWEEGGQ